MIGFMESVVWCSDSELRIISTLFVGPVQWSAHQSQACLTLATNSVEIGNSRFRCASRRTATGEVALAAILQDARQGAPTYHRIVSGHGGKIAGHFGTFAV